MDIYAPIANRIGFSNKKAELEHYCFQYLEPEKYRSLKEKMDELGLNHNEFIDSFFRNTSEMIY